MAEGEEDARDDAVLVVDADGHTMEPDDLWAARMDAGRWGDWIPRKVVEDGIYETIYVGGVVRAGGAGPARPDGRGGGPEPRGRSTTYSEPARRRAATTPTPASSTWTATASTPPSSTRRSALFFGPDDPIDALRDVDFVLACQRAYNDWVAEYCGAHPARLFAMAVVPLQDPELAVAEAAPRREHLGLRGVLIRPSAYVDELPLNHSVYDRFWAACQDLDVPVALHPGVHVDTPGRVPQVRARRREREPHGHEHGDGRAARRLRRSGRRSATPST